MAGQKLTKGRSKMSNTIKWFPGEIFAFMGEDQLRSILIEIEKEAPGLVKRVLTRRGHKIFGVDDKKPSQKNATVRGPDA
jgi:hypothetical protein